MILLSFDTCSEICYVALKINDKVTFYKKFDHKNKQSEMLVELINTALKKNNITYNDIDFLSLCNGPGSFTGIRVGLACANAIICATEAKAITVSMFELYQWRAQTSVKNFRYLFVILKSYGDKYYTQYFDFKENTALCEPTCISENEIKDLLLQFNSDEIVVAGNVMEKLSIMELLTQMKIMYLARKLAPKTLIQLTSKKIKDDNFNNTLSPLYVLPPSVRL